MGFSYNFHFSFAALVVGFVLQREARVRMPTIFILYIYKYIYIYMFGSLALVQSGKAGRGADVGDMAKQARFRNSICILETVASELRAQRIQPRIHHEATIWPAVSL